MKKILFFILLTHLTRLFFGLDPIYAAASCRDLKVTLKRIDNGQIVSNFTEGVYYESTHYSFRTATKEKFKVTDPFGLVISFNNTDLIEADVTLGLYRRSFSKGTYKFKIEVDRGNGWENYGDTSCDNLTFEVEPAPEPTLAPENCTITVKPQSEPDKLRNELTKTTPVVISADRPIDGSQYTTMFNVKRISEVKGQRTNEWPHTGDTKWVRIWDDGEYEVSFEAIYVGENYDPSVVPVNFSCTTKFNICDKGCGQIKPTPIIPTPIPTRPAICYGKEAQLAQRDGDCSGDYKYCFWCDKFRPTPTKRPKFPAPNLKPLCDQLTTENNFRGKCWECLNKKGHIWTAIGCVPIGYGALISEKLFPLGLGMVGGVAFLYFLYGAFMILTSAGNAEKIEEAKQIITSALGGLLLVIFSIFLLQVIGVQILQLPGFG